MDINKQKAFVIHSRPYKETSNIVTFLTEKHGKVDAIAKGAKRKKSKFSGNLEPFHLVSIDYGGRSNLKTLFLFLKIRLIKKWKCPGTQVSQLKKLRKFYLTSKLLAITK